MRFKQQIWDYYVKFTDEERLMKYRIEKGRENVLPFYEMETETFYRLFNAFRWLTKHNYPHIRIEETMTKPCNSDILEAMAIVKRDGERLLPYAKKHPKGVIRTGLIKQAKKKIACSDYYRKLVDEDFFADRVLQES